MSTISAYLEEELSKAFSPESLEIVNESHLHSGHAGDDGSGQTHFRIKIVAAAFDGMSRIDRHRAIMALAEPKMAEGLHAIAIEAKGLNG